MNKKLLYILCMMLALLMLVLPSCSKKKKQPQQNKDPDASSKIENEWTNIGDYEISSDLYLNVLSADGCDKLSAGCYDTEKYVYLALEGDDKSVVCKYDTKDKSLKKTSKAISINDINGICYKKNTIVILHGNKNISVFDSADFNLIETHTLIFECSSIAYNKGSDRFTLLLENGGISVMNADYEQTLMISGIGAMGENRAIACNNKYIFTVMAVDNGSEIVIYDWNGNYVSTASVSDVRKAPTLVYVDDGDLFIGYDSENGGAVYKTILEKR